MASSRRKFSTQFKAEAVQMVVATGKPVAEVARDLQINVNRTGFVGDSFIGFQLALVGCW